MILQFSLSTGAPNRRTTQRLAAGALGVITLLCTFFIGLKSLAQSSTDTSGRKNRKVVFVIADGIPADVIELVETPSLDSIAAEGRYLRATVGGTKNGYSETPTISAVGYNSLLTGTWANKHNVWNNDIQKPNYHYPTIFRLLKDQYPHKKIAVFSTWEDNRTKLIGEGLAATKNIKTDFSFDGLEKDTIRFPHDTAAYYIHLIDEAVVAKAVETITTQGPDLSWLYLEYTDDMGHRFGDSERFYESVRMMDAQMAKLWKAVKARETIYHEEWQIYITTDHGRDSITGKGHGRQTERERSTWIVTNAKDVNRYFDENKPAIVDIMPAIARYMDIQIPLPQQMELDGIPLIGKLSVANASVTKNNNKLVVRWKAITNDENVHAKDEKRNPKNQQVHAKDEKRNPKNQQVNAKNQKVNAKNEKVNIWLCTNNNFQHGVEDKYHLVATVPLIEEEISIDISAYQSGFYKIAVAGRHNIINCWLK